MTNAPHDALFKTIFGQPEHAAAELQHILPGHIAARIDWSSLTPQPGTYVDEELADQHSDLLFSAAAPPSEEPALVYVLFEHQSTAQPLMALRLLRYMVRIWKRHSNENPDAMQPLIIPAVFAHVPSGWTAPTRFPELFCATRRHRTRGSPRLPVRRRRPASFERRRRALTNPRQRRAAVPVVAARLLPDDTHVVGRTDHRLRPGARKPVPRAVRLAA